MASPDWQSSGALLEEEFKLPYKLDFDLWTYWHYGMPYNITTRTDANGDGDFNDRPSYAQAPGDGVYSTPYDLMTTNTVNGDVPRNLGSMPLIMHIYSNLGRSFALPSKKNDHPRALTLNARAVNILNHTNVTAAGTVVSSPTLGQGLSAEAARRIELGARFEF